MAKQDRSGEVLPTGLVFITLVWICFSLRVYVRGYLLKTFGWDDWLMGASVGFFTLYIISQMMGLYYGTGRHLADLTPEHAKRALIFWWLCEVSYIPAATFVKLSVGVFLHRIAVNRFHIWIIRTMMLLTSFFATIYFCAAIFQCWPIDSWWIRKHNPAIYRNRGWCFPGRAVVGVTFASSGLNSAADWAFGLLPIFIVKDLQMPRKQKKLVALILMFANIACVATIIRMPYIPNLGHDNDFLYDTVDIAIWSDVEPGIGIIAACLATLRPLYVRFFGNWEEWLSNRGASSGGRRYWPNKKHGSSGNSYAMQEGMPSLRPDRVGNYTEITAGAASKRGRSRDPERQWDREKGGQRSWDKRDTIVSAGELRSAHDVNVTPWSGTENTRDKRLTQSSSSAAPPLPSYSPRPEQGPMKQATIPKGVPSTQRERPSGFEIKKDIEFTLTEERENPLRASARQMRPVLSRGPSVSRPSQEDRGLATIDHFGMETPPRVSVSTEKATQGRNSQERAWLAAVASVGRNRYAGAAEDSSWQTRSADDVGAKRQTPRDGDDLRQMRPDGSGGRQVKSGEAWPRRHGGGSMPGLSRNEHGAGGPAAAVGDPFGAWR